MRVLRSSFLAFAPIACATLLMAAPAAAQPTERDAALAVVTKLFDAMRARDTAAMRAAFVPNGSLATLGDTAVRFDGIDGWINGIGRARPGLLLDERIANAVVQVDANLASVWVDYWFFLGDRLSHCGVDALLLTKQQGQWRIFSLVDTRRTQGCPPAPSR